MYGCMLPRGRCTVVGIASWLRPPVRIHDDVRPFKTLRCCVIATGLGSELLPRACGYAVAGTHRPPPARRPSAAPSGCIPHTPLPHQRARGTPPPYARQCICGVPSNTQRSTRARKPTRRTCSPVLACLASSTRPKLPQPSSFSFTYSPVSRNGSSLAATLMAMVMVRATAPAAGRCPPQAEAWRQCTGHQQQRERAGARCGVVWAAVTQSRGWLPAVWSASQGGNQLAAGTPRTLGVVGGNVCCVWGGPDG